MPYFKSCNLLGPFLLNNRIKMKWIKPCLPPEISMPCRQLKTKSLCNKCNFHSTTCDRCVWPQQYSVSRLILYWSLCMSCAEAFDPNFKMDVDGVTLFWQPLCTVLSCLGQCMSMLSNDKCDPENFSKLWGHPNWFYQFEYVHYQIPREK